MLHFLLTVLGAAQTAGGTGDLFGLVIACGGDFDGDGIAELVIADPIDGDREVSAGRVFAFSSRDFCVVREWTGRPGESLGSAIAPAGDLDRDGVSDLFLSTANVAGSARATIVSGKTGDELLAFDAPAHGYPLERAGLAFAPMGDLDGDGTPDFAIASPFEFVDGSKGRDGHPIPKPVGGRVSARSGKDASQLWVVSVEDQKVLYGADLASIGDVDGDGFADLAAAARVDFMRGGYVDVLSGRDGQRLRTLHELADSNGFTESLAAGFDLDSDGIGDLVAIQNGIPGQALAFSGKSGELFAKWPITARRMYQSKVLMIPDCDADGCADLALTSPGSGSEGSSFAIVSSKTARCLLSVAGGVFDVNALGCSVASIPDVDRDGVPDLAVGEATRRDHEWKGSVYVYSAKRGTLLTRLRRSDALVRRSNPSTGPRTDGDRR